METLNTSVHTVITSTNPSGILSEEGVYIPWLPFLNHSHFTRFFIKRNNITDFSLTAKHTTTGDTDFEFIGCNNKNHSFTQSQSKLEAFVPFVYDIWLFIADIGLSDGPHFHVPDTFKKVSVMHTREFLPATADIPPFSRVRRELREITEGLSPHDVTKEGVMLPLSLSHYCRMNS